MVVGAIQINRKKGVCEKCTVKVIEELFGNKTFNQWLDSFMQSRLVGYIPTYEEYYTRHGLRPCPACNATGFVDGKVCRRCNFIGAIAKNEQETLTLVPPEGDL